LLEAGRKTGKTRAEQQAIKAHREPEPRCAAGLWLAERGLARAMMDLSDGLSSDLPKMCAESGAGAEIYTSQLPLFEGAREWLPEPLELALHGGEDYELLFAVSPRKAAHLEATYPRKYPPITRIGIMTSRRGVFWMEKPGQSARPLAERGFDHFRVRPEKLAAKTRRR
jgi:thiamine-monophosphate kinase